MRQRRRALGSSRLLPDNHEGIATAGLTGLKGGIVRKVAVDKTRSSLEKALASIKQKLESQAQSSNHPG